VLLPASTAWSTRLSHSGFIGHIGLDEASLPADLLDRRLCSVLLMMDSTLGPCLNVGHQRCEPLPGKLQTDPSTNPRTGVRYNGNSVLPFHSLHFFC
jgi:hypothetical protein